MRLLYSPMSPFARKVRIVAHEAGLTGQIALTPVNPWVEGPLRAANPLSKVPALMLDDGTALYDSPVICEYLDALAGAGMVPGGGPARWAALRDQALADGIGDAAVRVFAEQRRPETERHVDLIDRQTAAIAAALDHLEAAFAPEDFRIAEISLAAQLGYLDFRQVLDWRPGRPRLAAWFEVVARRDSMIATEPVLL